jgi:hypothetical protein
MLGLFGPNSDKIAVYKAAFAYQGPFRKDFSTGSPVINLSCPLQTLDGEGQKETDNLQLKAPGRDRMDLPGKQCTQLAEDRFDVLANRLAQELLPYRHRPLGILLALGF